jgi:hypothetical protein|tara:strand:+ start:3264 stop:4274 length:1011 start_codon:yes stop_codon:yes gene_type:complete
MGQLVEGTLTKFASLHEGGRLALDADGAFRPWKIDGEPVPAMGEPLDIGVEGHLNGGSPLGVYPLVLRPDGSFVVRWGAVDWDIGDTDSFIHALNVSQVLKQLGAVSWIELSRSKGCHLWLYTDEWVPAGTMRAALINACDLASAPTTEVYPKQDHLDVSTGGWGNGLRLPYPLTRPFGRQVMIGPNMTALEVSSWVYDAYEFRTPAETIESIAVTWKKDTQPPPPIAPIATRPTQRRSHHEGDLKGLAKHIWSNGPRMGPKGNYDRSTMLHTFACELFRQGYLGSSVEMLVARLDQRWGQKFVGRADGARRIKDLVAKAHGVYTQPKLGEGERTV